VHTVVHKKWSEQGQACSQLACVKEHCKMSSSHLLRGSVHQIAPAEDQIIFHCALDSTTMLLSSWFHWSSQHDDQHFGNKKKRHMLIFIHKLNERVYHVQSMTLRNVFFGLTNMAQKVLFSTLFMPQMH